MEYRRNEIRAGIFLLASFVVLIVMIFAVSDIKSLFQQTRDIRVLFQFSDGIEKNAPVRFSGLKIGKVTRIGVAADRNDRIELVLTILKDTVIKTDTKATIKSLGLVGGKYVELTGGSAQAPMLPSNGTIMGEESLKLEDLTKAALEVVGRLKNIAANLDNLLGDPALSKQLKGTVANLQGISANIREMTSGKEEIAQGLKNLPEIIKKIDDSAANLKAITEKSNAIVGKTGEIVTENKKNIDAAMQHFRDMARNLKDASEEIKEQPWKLLRKP